MGFNKKNNFIKLNGDAGGSLPSQDLLSRVGVILLCGGDGKRLDPLTHSRCKPIVSFGGRYRLIDVPISHAVTSGFSKIFILGQYLTHTLRDHIANSRYCFRNEDTYPEIHLLSSEESKGSHPIRYKGTADAVRQNLDYLNAFDVDYFLILSGDQLYNINFQEMLEYARETGAGMLIAAQPVALKDVSRMGIIKIDESDGRIIDFHEKPTDESDIESFKLSEGTLMKFQHSENVSSYLASMGIYFFKKEALFSLLSEDPGDDFGKHLIQTQIRKQNVYTFLFDGYWADIGTIESYYEANLKLIGKRPDGEASGLCCYDDQGVILGQRHHLPGSVINHSLISNSLVCEGCIVDGAQVFGSLLGVRSKVGENTSILNSIVLGNDCYGNEVGISSDCVIEKSIIDENTFLGKGVKLVNQGNYWNFDSPDKKIAVRDGIIVVRKGTVLPDYYVF